MTEPLSEPAFDALMRRAGLVDLAPDEQEEIRQATRHVARFAARVRAPEPPTAAMEPAPRFAPEAPRS